MKEKKAILKDWFRNTEIRHEGVNFWDTWLNTGDYRKIAKDLGIEDNLDEFADLLDEAYKHNYSFELFWDRLKERILEDVKPSNLITGKTFFKAPEGGGVDILENGYVMLFNEEGEKIEDFKFRNQKEAIDHYRALGWSEVRGSNPGNPGNPGNPEKPEIKKEQKITFELGTFKEEGEIKQRIFIDWEIDYQDKEAITVDYQKIKGYYVLHLTAEIKKGKATEETGQINERIWDLWKQKMLDLSIKEADFYRLMEIWEKFHLNDSITDWDRWLLLPLPSFVFDFGEKLKKYSK